MQKTSPLKIIARTIIVLLFAGIYLFYESQCRATDRMIASEQARILYHIDHKILAAEARKFAKQRRAEAVTAGLPLLQVFFPGDPDIPPSLAILQTRSIQVLDGYVQFEFGGFLLHYGIVVYDEGLEGPGTKKLEEGVWFYSENGRYPGRDGDTKKGPLSRG